MTQETEKLFEVPALFNFHKDHNIAWEIVQNYLKKKGNPPWSLWGDINLGDNTSIRSLGNLRYIQGNANLAWSSIEDLGELTEVGGRLNLSLSSIELKSLGNLNKVGGCLSLEGTGITSLGNLEFVGSNLDLSNLKIESLGKLKYVGSCIVLSGTPLSKKYTKEEIEDMLEELGGLVVY